MSDPIAPGSIPLAPPPRQRPLRVLIDAWRPASPVPLDGWLERNAFSPALMVLLVGVAGLIVFQGLGAVVGITLIVVRVGADVALDPISVLAEHIDLVIVGNTVGQFVGLGLLTFLVARLHSRRLAGFVRLRGFDGGLLGLSVLGLVFLIPLVQWLGTLNAQLPLPEFAKAFDEQQQELIEGLLTGKTSLWFNLVNLALTPALCEELFFRGYLQRQLERSAGFARGILWTGVIFGIFHLRPTQVVPLAVLGIYLCYVTWRTGSIVPAVVLHLLYNGAQILAGHYIAQDPALDLETLENAQVPWYVVLPGVLLFGGVVRWMTLRARDRIGGMDSPTTLASESETTHDQEALH